MNKKWHKEALEAVGMYGKKGFILNKLNRVYAHTEDSKLRELIKLVQIEVRETSNNSEAAPINSMKNGVPTAIKLSNYCKSVLFK